MTNVYHGDTFSIHLNRYSDPQRLNAARNAAIYLGKPDRDNTARPLSIIRQGHVPAIFRGECAEFEFRDVSKEVYDHLVTYSTANMRIAGGNRALTSDDFTLPSDNVKNPGIVGAYVEGSMNNYKLLLSCGETPQVARAAMPIAAKLNPFVFQFNLLTLMEAVFPQRIWTPGAQKNTKKVVEGMWALVSHQDPTLWETVLRYYGPQAQAWKQVLHKLSKSDPSLLKELLDTYGSSKSMWE